MPRARDAENPTEDWWVVLKGYYPGVKASIREVVHSIVNVDQSCVLHFTTEDGAVEAWRYALTHGLVGVLNRTTLENLVSPSYASDHRSSLDEIASEEPEDSAHRTGPEASEGNSSGSSPILAAIRARDGRNLLDEDPNFTFPSPKFTIPSLPMLSHRLRSVSLGSGSSAFYNDLPSMSEASSEFMGAIQMDWAERVDGDGPVYMVHCGRTPGFYSAWEDAHRQIHAAPGGAYQRFPNLREARSSFLKIWERRGLAVVYTAKAASDQELADCTQCYHPDPDGS